MGVDVEISVQVSRDGLGLGPLEIASSPDYYLGTQFLGAVVQWNRQEVNSQWLDGGVTLARHRQLVVEQIGVEVKGPDLPTVQARIDELVEAFIQDVFVLTVVTAGTSRVYRCEAADYQDLSWTTPRMAAAQGQVLFSVPRQPVALSGGF